MVFSRNTRSETPKRLTQRHRHELLKDDVHVHQKPGRPYLSAAGLERAVPQHEPR